jgi:hypothetical protein
VTQDVVGGGLQSMSINGKVAGALIVGRDTPEKGAAIVQGKSGEY